MIANSFIEPRVESPARVLVVDDFAPFRCWVSSFLREELGLEVIGGASDGGEAVEKGKELRPDIILLDIGLPKLNGIEAARRIRRVAPGSKIVFLTQETSADIVEAALKSGGLGYVTKANASADLPKAIEAVIRGKQFISAGTTPNTKQAAD